MLNVMGYRG